MVVRATDDELAEIVVCNNYTHQVTRHVVDRADENACLDEDIILQAALNVPDGATFSPVGRLVGDQQPLHARSLPLSLRPPRSVPRDEPDGVLHGVNYPHGLRFTADGRYMLIADAGLPYVHVYHAPRR